MIVSTLTTFYRDLEAAKPAEQLVFNLLSSTGYEVEDVSDQPQYYYKGDIKLTSSSGEVFFIDVKDDSRIAETGNVLCEYDVWMKDRDEFIDGDMKKSYDYLAIVSWEEQKVYFIDFHTLKQKYKQGTHVIIKHQAQDTWGYLVQLAQIKS